MITAIVSASVKCGSKGSLERLHKLPEAAGADHLEPMAFRCRRCHQEWGKEDADTAQDLDRASCSNCYSGNIEVSKVMFSYLSAKDFNA